MLLFLYGPDTYRSRRKLQEITEHYRKVRRSGLNLQHFDFKEKSFEDFRNALSLTPMFKEKKLFVLLNGFANSQFREEFLKWAKKNGEGEDVLLFYEAGEVSAKEPLFRLLKSKAKTQEFKPLGGLKLKNWVQKECRERLASISPSGLDKLIDFVGADLWQMASEMDKLAAYTKKISPEDVELLVQPKIDADIFKTIDALAQKDKKTALYLLRRHLGKGDSPLYLLSMINFQFRNLLLVKDLLERRMPYDVLLKEARMHPFIVKKCLWQAPRFTLEELKKIFSRVFQADLDIKTGRLEPELALDLFVAGI